MGLNIIKYSKSGWLFGKHLCPVCDARKCGLIAGLAGRVCFFY